MIPRLDLAAALQDVPELVTRKGWGGGRREMERRWISADHQRQQAAETLWTTSEACVSDPFMPRLPRFFEQIVLDFQRSALKGLNVNDILSCPPSTGQSFPTEPMGSALASYRRRLNPSHCTELNQNTSTPCPASHLMKRLQSIQVEFATGFMKHIQKNNSPITSSSACSFIFTLSWF
ncbi:hypothetical protein EYF80_037220 [Liparis tanakae]|uniref:Uncharacterized protein n=1 Tax=Liparis tanakae TaxID=230148 RepID=A0A4Z2GGH3_9TELE|nr:hypothetical protein EYF80_037220 [Liparis tanakae]